MYTDRHMTCYTGMMKSKRLIELSVLIAVILFAVFIGNDAIKSADIVRTFMGNGSRTENVIMFQVRLPRIAAAFFAGAALSVSGYLLQNNLNNAIASPSLLGINNGAGVFVLLSALLFPFRADLKCIMAFVGAILVTGLVSLISMCTGMSKTSVILAGVAVSSLSVSIADMMIVLHPETVADKAAFQLGGFSGLSVRSLYVAVPVILIIIFIVILTAPALDIMVLGDETAAGLGLNVTGYRLLHVLCAAILAGAAVSMSGLIGFVGLIVPNVIRNLNRDKSRTGLVMCTLYGGAFLLLCDTLARILTFPYELPCGLILSVIGAPTLIWILIRRRKRLGTR